METRVDLKETIKEKTSKNIDRFVYKSILILQFEYVFNIKVN